MIKRYVLLIPLLVFLLTGCGAQLFRGASESRSLTIFAASSLTDAFLEIGKAFESSHSDVTIAFNFAGSQTLRTQIEEGAPASVFATASGKEMDRLVTGKFVTAGTPQVFLTNKPIVILPANNPAGLEKLEDLARPGIKLVLAAADVPVGNYARQALDRMNDSFGTDFKDKVLANVVSNEDNVKQVVAKIQLGEADAGIVYLSDSLSAPDLQKIEIPDDLNVIAEYLIAALTDSTNSDLANEFISSVVSTEGRATLKKWGFTPVAH